VNRTVILGTGAAVPKKVLTNQDLESMVDTSDEWISTRTGIKSRYIAEDGETTSTLATKAARRALDMAGVKPQEIDMIIVGTTSPDMIMPNTGALVQKNLGAANAFGFDVYAACSGFVYALTIADKFVKENPEKKILAIGSELLSSITDWQDRNTCVLFGDAAGAALVSVLTMVSGASFPPICTRMGVSGNCFIYREAGVYIPRVPKWQRSVITASACMATRYTSMLCDR
jgi:3-oxoacyl-[acyl-carrier-protein] synthase-3